MLLTMTSDTCDQEDRLGKKACGFDDGKHGSNAGIFLQHLHNDLP